MCSDFRKKKSLALSSSLIGAARYPIPSPSVAKSKNEQTDKCMYILCMYGGQALYVYISFFHRSDRKAMWSWFQTWLSGTNTWSHIYCHFFKCYEYFITHLYIVFEIGQKNNLYGYYVCEHINYFSVAPRGWHNTKLMYI